MMFPSYLREYYVVSEIFKSNHQIILTPKTSKRNIVLSLTVCFVMVDSFTVVTTNLFLEDKVEFVGVLKLIRGCCVADSSSAYEL